MIGYVLQPGTQWQESTDMQDEEHLVQITATNTADRFTRYPKVSQGDWTGGERQVFTPVATGFTSIISNAYYNTDGNINTLIPGNLTLFPAVGSQSFTPGVTPNNLITAATKGFYWVNYGTGAHNLTVGPNIGTVPTSVTAGSGDKIAGMVNTPFFEDGAASDEIIIGLATGGTATKGVLQVDNTGMTIAQYANDAVLDGTCASMCYFHATIYYLDQAQHIKEVPYATPGGNASGTTKFTLDASEANFQFLVSTGNTMYFGTFGVSDSNIYSFDGTTATLIGTIPGRVVGVGNNAGDLYLLCKMIPSISQTVNQAYAIYQAVNNSLSIFDDLRAIPNDFQTQQATITTTALYGDAEGSLASDGRYLYAALPGSPLRAYDLATTGNPSFQIFPLQAITPASQVVASTVLIYPNSGGNSAMYFVADNSPDVMIFQQIKSSVTSSGYVNLSYDDFGAPTTVKSFRSVDLEMVTPIVNPDPSLSQPGNLPSQVTVKYRLDNTAAFTTLPVPTVTSNGNLTVPFPLGIQGSRVQVQVGLGSGLFNALPGFTGQLGVNPLSRLGNIVLGLGLSSQPSPVVRSTSIKANLGRVWTFTVACTRNQSLRNGAFASSSGDTQGLRAQDLLANIVNAYSQNAGDVVMFIPSPSKTAAYTQTLKGSAMGVANSVSVPAGVEVVFGTLEDYKWTASAQPGPYNTEYGSLDMEGTVQLTVVESLQ